MISVSELVHTFGIGRNYNLARTSYVTDGHISISSQNGKVQPPLRFCKVSGGPSRIYVIGLPNSHILHGYIHISSQDGECNHRGDFWKGLGAPSIICGLELVRTFYLRHCNLRRSLCTTPTLKSIHLPEAQSKWNGRVGFASMLNGRWYRWISRGLSERDWGLSAFLCL